MGGSDVGRGSVEVRCRRYTPVKDAGFSILDAGWLVSEEKAGAGGLQRIRVDLLASIDGLRLFSTQDPASSIKDRGNRPNR
jgi:hypothetical protein